ncbi:MAG TPA: methyltransferase domain-containing protein [Thermomicrobiales bacterium]|nr:methyltransferase domain-containing protein [Thermomicrobiales bacterium]
MDDMDEQARLVAEVRDIWDAKAAFWDEQMGEGNQFQLELIGPAVEDLLVVRPGERVLDVGCGNGVSSRRLARLGAHVVAIDASERFLELARSRSEELSNRIEYRLVDVTDEEQLLALGEGRFDALVCNMVLMDMPVIDPLARAGRRLLAPGGRFVFAVQHPAFNSNAVRLCAETETRSDGIEVTRHAVKMSDYLVVPPGKGTGMPGEPEPHWYFHRPLHELFRAFFQAGFVLDGLEERALTPRNTNFRTLSWSNLPGIPPVLVGRFVPHPVGAGGD